MNKQFFFKVSTLLVLSGIILILIVVIGAPLFSQTEFSSVLMFTLLLLGFSMFGGGVMGIICVLLSSISRLLLLLLPDKPFRELTKFIYNKK